MTRTLPAALLALCCALRTAATSIFSPGRFRLWGCNPHGRPLQTLRLLAHQASIPTPQCAPLSAGSQRVRILASTALYVTCCALPAHATDGLWAPLTAEEIADAHGCTGEYKIGDNTIDELVICAGDKRIGVGIVLAPNRAAATLAPDEKIKDPMRLFPTLPPEATNYTAVFTIHQTAESGGPEWKREYYIITDKELAHIIDKARREPEWKP